MSTLEVSFTVSPNDLLYRLIEACTEGDAGELVKQAAREHIPVSPSRKKPTPSSSNVVAFRPPMPQIIEELKLEEWYKDQIVAHRSFEEREAQLCMQFCVVFCLGTHYYAAELSTPLSDSIAEGLRKARSVTKFYSHQAAAINAIAEGKHVIVSTATASGKSLIYQAPLLRFLEEDRESTAIYIYPTKVLHILPPFTLR